MTKRDNYDIGIQNRHRDTKQLKTKTLRDIRQLQRDPENCEIHKHHKEKQTTVKSQKKQGKEV